MNDGEDREGVRGEKVGGRNGRLGSGEGRYSSARSTQLAERGPSGSRRPFAKIYTRRHTENNFHVYEKTDCGCGLGACGIWDDN